jgi:hypothetical protein
MRDSLNMLGGSDLSFIYPQKIIVGTIYVNSFLGLPTTPFAEATTNESNAGTNLVIKGGVEVPALNIGWAPEGQSGESPGSPEGICASAFLPPTSSSHRSRDRKSDRPSVLHEDPNR